MLYSITEALGTGSPLLVAVPPFIHRDHITVRVDALATTGFEWVSDSTIRITAGLNHPIRVIRNSSQATRLSTYLDGQGLPADSLELDSLQAFYLAQEAIDLAYLGGSAGGNPAPGIELTTQGIKDLLAGQITPSELETTLRTTISLIDANAAIVNSPAWRVAQEALGRAAAIAAESAARAAALAQEALNRGAAILVETTARQDADASLASSITTLTASTGANAAAVQAEVTARTDADSTLASSITTLATLQTADVATLTASVTAEQTARTTADTALASTVETNRVAAATAATTLTASINSVDTASVSRDSALSSRVVTLEAAYIAGGGYDDASIRADLAAVDLASASRDSALSGRVVSLRAGSYGASLTPDPEMRGGAEFWTDVAGTTTVVGGSVAGRFARQAAGAAGHTFSLDTVAVDHTRAYKVSGRFRRSSDMSSGRTCYLAVRLFDGAGVEIFNGGGSYWFYAWAGDPGTSWGDHSGVFGAGTARPLPGTAVSMGVAALLFWDDGASGAVGYAQVEALRIDDYEVTRRTTELQASINTVDSARVTDRDAAVARLVAQPEMHR